MISPLFHAKPPSAGIHQPGFRSRLSKTRAGFTLIEMLVVIAIIALLASLLVPATQRALANAKAAVCMSRLRSLALAATLYETDHQGTLPFPGGLSNGWLHVLPPYLNMETPYQLASEGVSPVPSTLTCPVQFAHKPAHYTYGMNLGLRKGWGNPDGLLPTNRSAATRNGRSGNPITLSASTIPYFMDGHIWSYSGRFRDWRSSDEGFHENISPVFWEMVFPHNDGCNIVYLDGHVSRTRRGEGILNGQRLYYEDNQPVF
jgi:prepilin-type N-terminal cleavage/methylation domain-containing protein/prepilin-type processing-associated H-X9-DG protein